MMVLIPNQMTKIDFETIVGKKEVIIKVITMDTISSGCLVYKLHFLYTIFSKIPLSVICVYEYGKKLERCFFS